MSFTLSSQLISKIYMSKPIPSVRYPLHKNYGYSWLVYIAIHHRYSQIGLRKIQVMYQCGKLAAINHPQVISTTSWVGLRPSEWFMARVYQRTHPDPSSGFPTVPARYKILNGIFVQQPGEFEPATVGFGC